jgi:hypothetical protein
MPTKDERNAAFDKVKPHILQIVPAMFQSYVDDRTILALVDDALNAAEKVRAKTAPKPSAV